jgi:hypothetical protein
MGTSVDHVQAVLAHSLYALPLIVPTKASLSHTPLLNPAQDGHQLHCTVSDTNNNW